MKKVFVIPYFGRFPKYIQLWLDSCGRNPEFNWLLITDCSIECLNPPNNVLVINSTIEDVKEIFKTNINTNICLNKPYKICDFRPAYWMLLDYYNIEYDFWGYCDMDLIFGRLSNFLPDELFEKYDRIYSQGHLSLMSSSPFSKYAFIFEGAEVKWDQVFFKNINYGFDELHGVNKIWKKQKFLFYEKNSDILDIDPQFSEFYLTHVPSNKRKQIFYIEDGKVLHGFWNKKNEYSAKEFAYIHFQKRLMEIHGDVFNCNRFIICSSGFRCLKIIPEKYEDLQSLITNSESLRLSVVLKKTRTYLRFYKQRIYKKRLINDI